MIHVETAATSIGRLENVLQAVHWAWIGRWKMYKSAYYSRFQRELDKYKYTVGV